MWVLWPAPAAGAQEPRRSVVLFDGVEFPTGIAFDSRGTMYFNERPGRIRVARSDRLDPRPLAEIPTTTAGETGLLGIAVSPDDAHVYVFATAPDGSTNEIHRVPVEGGEPQTVVEGLPASLYHNGGGVAFAPDGTLLVSNGERHETELSQDPRALGGKVYRFTPEGGVPADNPFGDTPTFALGLRNPYGMTVDPVSGDAFVTENGPDAFDEVNRVRPGGNYGWPLVSGTEGDLPAAGAPGEYHEPLLAYEHIVVPTGIAFAPDARRLGALAGDLFFATFGESAIHRVELSPERDRALSDRIFLRSPEPVVALAWGPRGLYYSTPTQLRLIPVAGGRPSPEEEPLGSSPAPVPQAEAERDPRDERSLGGLLLQVALAALLLGGLAWSFRGGRRPPSGGGR